MDGKTDDIITDGDSEDILIDGKALELISKMIEENPVILWTIPQVRAIVAAVRLRQQHQIRHVEQNGDYVHDHTLVHNLNALQNYDAFHRPDRLFDLLAALPPITASVPSLRLLIIGPRSEYELFSAYTKGFGRDNVSAIDLISYSNLIEMGDMHHMPYDDNTFDVVMAGFVMAYSKDNSLAAREIMRVSKPGAYIAMGCVAEPVSMTTPEAIENAVGGIMFTSDDPERPGETKTVSRYFKTSQILKLFGDRIARVLVSCDPIGPALKRRSDILCIFQLT
jgi:hypothetical protein